VENWIQQVLSSGQWSLAVLPAVFLMGALGSVSSCCTLPVVGAVAGYAVSLGPQNRRREIITVGVFFMIGTILSLAILGALTGFVSQMASTSLGRYWKLAAGLLMVLFGLNSLGLAPLRLPQFNLGKRAVNRGITGAILYGLAVGGASTACSVGCNPLLGVVVGAAVLQGAALTGSLIFAVFALGFSLPLAAGLVGIGMGIGRLGAATQKALPVLRIAAGILLIGVGFYLLATI
jgi:cytochrome c biogenesis protein CcdA